MVLTIIPLYLAVLALVYLVLSFRVIGLRRSRKVALGSARDKALERAIRVHANFSEYVPLIGLLLVILEVQGSPVWLLHGLGGLLLIGRLLHAYGLAQIEEDFRFRTTGMMMTFVALGAAAIAVMVRVLV